MQKYIMALDQGTTSSRCMIFDKKGTVITKAQQEFDNYYPQAGWVEQDAKEIWNSQLSVAQKALKNMGDNAINSIAAIGITNQRETTVVWDKQTGEPIYNAIVWQCRRTVDKCAEIKSYFNKIKAKTGLRIDPYFSATKVAWLLDYIPGARLRAERGELLFGTVDTWLIWNLTKGKVHATDYSNASRTMLYNIHELDWDDEILDLLNIPRCMLPEVRNSAGTFGEADLEFFGISLPISGVAGDQQASLFGQACFSPGQVKNTYGTGGFLLMNTGELCVDSDSGLLSTIAWGLDGKITYALEGSIFVAGAAIQWLRDKLQIIDHAAETEEIARSIPDTGGVYMVPAFSGLGAPYWNPYVKGAIVGLTQGTERCHIVRAALESLAYQTVAVMNAMQADAGIDITGLKVDGGASANNFLLEFQSGILNMALDRPSCIETTALGAACLAGLGCGYFGSLCEIQSNWQPGRHFEPRMSREKRAAYLQGWEDAVAGVCHTVKKK